MAKIILTNKSKRTVYLRNKGRLYLSLVLTCVIHISVKELKIETTTIVIKKYARMKWNRN